MNELNPYLFFPGNCREAMEFYRSVFGGELIIQTQGDVDPAAPDDIRDFVIHAGLAGGDIGLMASDRQDATQAAQTRVALSLSGNDEEKLRRQYDILSAGGSADYPLKKEYWGDTFGSLTDRYGINWMVNINSPI